MPVRIPTSPLASRASLFLSRALTHFSRGQAAGARALLDGIKQLVSSIGTTALRVRPLLPGELVYRDDYVAMVDEARHDVQSAHATLPQLAQRGIETANYGEAQRVALTERLQAIVADVSRLDALANREVRGHNIGSLAAGTDIARQRGETFVETFATDRYIDYTRCRDIYFHPDAGTVTLKRAADTSHREAARVFVDFFSGQAVRGFPGNTVEVEAPALSSIATEDQTPQVRFIGETLLNASPAAILDPNPDTVYEFERVALATDSQPLRKVGDAWVYADGAPAQRVYDAIAPDDWSVAITAVDDGGETRSVRVRKLDDPRIDNPQGLVCDLVITLGEPRPLNLLEIDPYISSRTPRAIPVYVASITVTAADGTQLVLNPDQDGVADGQRVGSYLLHKTTYPLPRTILATTVQIRFMQHFFYETTAGHNFVVATVETRTKRKALGFTYSDKTAVEKIRLKTQDEALRYGKDTDRDFTLGATMLGLAVGGPAGAAVGWLLGSLFGKSVTQTVRNVARGVDLFKAHRWQVGLRGIDLRQIVYAQQGVFVSAPIPFTQPVEAVRVVPSEINRHVDATLLTFDVSADDGATWIPLDPRAQTITPLPSATNSVRVRATMERRDQAPEDVALTPVLTGYKVEGYYA